MELKEITDEVRAWFLEEGDFIIVLWEGDIFITKEKMEGRYLLEVIRRLDLLSEVFRYFRENETLTRKEFLKMLRKVSNSGRVKCQRKRKN